MLVKLSLMHSERGLFPGTAQNELPSGFAHAVRKILQCLQTRRIDGRHVSKPQNNDRREIGQARDNRVDLVGRAKQERPVDSEDADVSRDFLVLQDMYMSFVNVLCG